MISRYRSRYPGSYLPYSHQKLGTEAIWNTVAIEIVVTWTGIENPTGVNLYAMMGMRLNQNKGVPSFVDETFVAYTPGDAQSLSLTKDKFQAELSIGSEIGFQNAQTVLPAIGAAGAKNTLAQSIKVPGPQYSAAAHNFWAGRDKDKFNVDVWVYQVAYPTGIIMLNLGGHKFESVFDIDVDQPPIRLSGEPQPRVGVSLFLS